MPGWVRATRLLGMGESFASEAQQVEDAMRAGAQQCWEETTEPCYTSYEKMLEASRLPISSRRVKSSAEARSRRQR